MGYRQTRKLHDNCYSKLVIESLRFLRGLVVFIGKPFYLLLFNIISVLGTTISHLSNTFQIRHNGNNYKLYTKNTFYVIALFSFTFLLFYSFILYPLPSPKSLSTNHPPLSTKIYDRNGILLYKIYENENRSLVKLSDIPKHTILATLAIEDNEFYRHPGFSVKGILRALYKNIREDKLYGGSTITQQLVKNTLLTPEKSIQRKIKELILAFEVELIYSKNEILEMYLNNSPYGGTIYGVKEASLTYFNKELKDLTLAESAFLAGIPKSPTSYSPFIGNVNASLERQKEVLNLMLENRFISESDYNKAISEDLVFSKNTISILAPHFVMYVKDELINLFGHEMVTHGGLDVTTTLDTNIQKIAEDVVNSELDKLKNLKVTNAGVIILDPKSGGVVALVGSKDYFDIENRGNVNTVMSVRPPGSTIKIVNYAYALSHGYNLTTKISDTPITFRFQNSPPYSPVNYDRTFKGDITVRNALAQSRNVPAIKILNSYGVDKMIDMGKTLGITSWNTPEKYGLSITLGGANTTLFDLAQVYLVFANYGKKQKITSIIQINDYNKSLVLRNDCLNDIDQKIAGVLPTITEYKKSDNLAEVLFGSLINPLSASYSADKNTNSPNQCSGEGVIDPRIAFLITDILKDNKARAPTFGTNSQLNIKSHPEVAVKTGTSNSMRDNIAIGYNQDYLVAVWVGNNDNSPMSNIASGITGATPIFNKIMTELLKDKESVEWQVPQGLVKKPVCSYYKRPENEEVVIRKYDEWFLEENVPKNTCPPGDSFRQ